MAIRDKLNERVSPLIEFRHPGERLESVFLAQTTTWMGVRRYSNYVVAVTDRSVVVFSAGLFTRATPRDEVASFPRDALTGLERHAFRHGPRGEDTVTLEAKVVVQAPRVMPLHDKDRLRA